MLTFDQAAPIADFGVSAGIRRAARARLELKARRLRKPSKRVLRFLYLERLRTGLCPLSF